MKALPTKVQRMKDEKLKGDTWKPASRIQSLHANARNELQIHNAQEAARTAKPLREEANGKSKSKQGS